MGEPTLSETITKARQLLRAGRNKENLALLEAAVTKFPADSEVRLLYATALVPFRPEDASPEVVRAIELDPDDPILLTRAAHLLFHLGEVESSRNHAVRATQLAPEDFVFAGELANLCGKLAIEKGDDQLAEEALRAAVEFEPHEDVLVRDLACFLAESGRVDEAIGALDDALAARPDAQPLQELRAQLATPE